MIAEIAIKHHIGKNTFAFDCTINAGITGVYGPSGAGKTTMLNMLSGLEKPVEGRIRINGDILYDSSQHINISEANRKIGYVFQDTRLFPHLSVRQNLNYSLPYINKKEQFITLEEVIDLLDIEPLISKKPRQLSGGERQRVAIGRALLIQPSLLLLDEPFSNLDRYLRKQIISYLLKINHQFKVPMLIVSHIIGDILRLTNEMIVINHGKVIASGDIFTLMTENRVPEIIKPRRYLNIYDARFEEKDHDDKLYKFCHCDTREVKFFTSSRIAKRLKKEDQIRFAIRPDDIALSKEKLHNISIQNQLKGKVSKIISTEKSTFCIIDCGIDLVVEITEAAISKLQIQQGETVYCLIKAKAIEIIHVFE